VLRDPKGIAQKKLDSIPPSAQINLKVTEPMGPKTPQVKRACSACNAAARALKPDKHSVAVCTRCYRRYFPERRPMRLAVADQMLSDLLGSKPKTAPKRRT
jgi:hypothetical protein